VQEKEAIPRQENTGRIGEIEKLPNTMKSSVLVISPKTAHNQKVVGLNPIASILDGSDVKATQV